MSSSYLNEELKNWAAFFAIAILGFGTSFYWIKIALRELTPLEIVTYRVSCGAICLWITTILLRLPIPRDCKVMFKIAFAGLIGTVVPFLLITWAEKSISSGIASILNSLTPIFTVILSAIFVTRSDININTIIGIILGFFGTVIIFFRNLELSTSAIILLPELAVILAAGCYALLTVYVKINFQKENPFVLSTLATTFAALFLWIELLIIQADFQFPTQSYVQFSIIWMGVVSTACAQILVYYLIRRWNPTKVSLIAYVIPIVAVLLGVVMLNETMAINTIIGTIIIIISIFLANQRKQIGG